MAERLSAQLLLGDPRQRQAHDKMNIIDIDLETCNGCEICSKTCSVDVIRWVEMET